MADPFAALNKACVKTFGTAVSYQQGTDAPFAVMGVVMKDSDEERLREGLYARLFVGLADFTTHPEHGDVVILDGVMYTVFEVNVDSMGGIVLSMRAAA